MRLLFFACVIPFSTVVLATKYGHFFVVEKGNASQRSLLSVINIAAKILCWKRESQISHLHTEKSTHLTQMFQMQESDAKRTCRNS